MNNRKSEFAVSHSTLASKSFLVAGRPFIMLAGETHNSASSDASLFEVVARKYARLGCNTVLSPVTWELIEPQEGTFDFRMLDHMLQVCRQEGLRLIPLWFGAYKNAASTYAPEWVKRDVVRFPRACPRPGVVLPNTVSVFNQAIRDADARAFATMMSHLRQTDSDHRTALMVQVNNEVGLLGGARDHSSPAEQAYAQDVPAELVEFLSKPGARPQARGHGGSWREVFGEDADEAFMAWGFASHVQAVASAGRAAYHLPLFVNAWLVQRPGQFPGAYPSGGPVTRVIDLWKSVARSIDLFTPDIYVSDFEDVCADYAQANLALFIPELRLDDAMVARLLYAIGQHRAIGVAPFGLEDAGGPVTGYLAGPVADGSHEAGCSARTAALWQQVCTQIGNAFDFIHHCGQAGRMLGVLATADRAPQYATLGGFRFEIHFPRAVAGEPTPGALILSPRDGEFLAIGFGVTFYLHPPANCYDIVDLIRVEEGRFESGVFVPTARLNGDEFGFRLGRDCTVLRVHAYMVQPAS